MRAFVLGVALLAGCASAGKDDGFIGGHVDAPVGGQHDAPNNQQVDAKITPGVDAPVSVDAPAGPMTKILNQTTDQTVTVGSSVTCGNNTLGYTSANSWYRVFTPGVAGVYHVQHVDFAAQEASAGDTVKVSVGTYAGAVGAATLNTGQMTPLISNVSVAVGATTTGEPLSANTAVDIPAGANMYVQIDTPDYSAGGTQFFYIGASAGGETTAGYILATACSVNTPEKLTTASATAGALILTVTGTY